MEAFDSIEDYDLSFAEGTQVDEKLLASFKKTARGLGIAQDKAQKLADMYALRLAESAQESDAAWGETQKGWEAEITSRPNFKQEVGAARKVLRDYGNAEKLFPLLQHSLLGSHPEFFDFMVNVSKALGSSNRNSQGAGRADTQSKPLAERLWPDKG